MKIDEDLIDGVKIFGFVCGIIAIISMALVLVGCLVKYADNYRRENNKKDIEFWASNGCVLIGNKFNQPIYKCEERK